MTRPERRMVDVELVEERSDELGAGADERPRGRRPSRGLSHRWALPVAAALAVGVVLAWSVRAEIADERADDALLAAFADVAGIAPSLREPLTEPWLLAVPASVDVTGRGAECPASVADGSLLVCQVFGEPGQGGPTTDAVLGGTPDRLVVLAADDGRVVAERELGTTAIGWAVLDDDLVLATRVGQAATVERSGAVDGRARWRTEVPLPRDVPARQMHLAADAFVVLSGPVAGVLDAETGELLGTWTASGGGRVPVQVATSTVGFAVWTSPQEGIWFDSRGAPGARLPGAPVVPAIDDGSLPGVLLLQDARVLRAVDVHAGILWERPRVQRVPVRLDGIVVLEDDGGLRATDLASGTDRWSVQAATAALGGVVATDGVRLLTAGRDATVGQVLRAYDLRDGSLAWTTPIPGPLP